jgi:predicted DNA-binding transcriptional regulator YafY
MKDLKNTQKRLLRLAQILKILSDEDKVSTLSLSEEFQTTQRTIQRDICFLKEAGFPLSETGHGIYSMDKNILRNLEVFEDTELALIVALKNIVGQLGEPFRRAADVMFNRLYDSTNSTPVFVKMDESIPVEKQLFNRIIKSIHNKKQVAFQYMAFSPHIVRMEPYRVVHFDGFWYLVGLDMKNNQIKRYALDKIKDFRIAKTCFKCVPDSLDRTLQQSGDIWFSKDRNQEVLILVNASMSHYFKRRKIFPTQEIVEEKVDGSLVVRFLVGRYEEIRNVLKVWLPFVVILKPKEFCESLLDDLKKWIQWQEQIKDTDEGPA